MSALKQPLLDSSADDGWQLVRLVVTVLCVSLGSSLQFGYATGVRIALPRKPRQQCDHPALHNSTQSYTFVPQSSRWARLPLALLPFTPSCALPVRRSR
jgi:hypothetical protein